MHFPDNQGNTKFDLLSKFSKKTGKQHPDLKPPVINNEILYIWDWFIELNSQRTSNGYGANPIQYIDIQAWSTLTKKNITAWEVKAIRYMDNIWLSETAKIKDSQKQ